MKVSKTDDGKYLCELNSIIQFTIGGQLFIDCRIIFCWSFGMATDEQDLSSELFTAYVGAIFQRPYPVYNEWIGFWYLLLSARKLFSKLTKSEMSLQLLERKSREENWDRMGIWDYVVSYCVWHKMEWVRITTNVRFNRFIDRLLRDLKRELKERGAKGQGKYKAGWHILHSSVMGGGKVSGCARWGFISHSHSRPMGKRTNGELELNAMGHCVATSDKWYQ